MIISPTYNPIFSIRAGGIANLPVFDKSRFTGAPNIDCYFLDVDELKLFAKCNDDSRDYSMPFYAEIAILEIRNVCSDFIARGGLRMSNEDQYSLASEVISQNTIKAIRLGNQDEYEVSMIADDFLLIIKSGIANP